MSLFTLPLEETMLQLSCLQSLNIISCWSLKSLGALHKLYLERFEVYFCPCLEFENKTHGTSLPSSLKWFKLRWCTISSGIFRGEFPKLNYVYLGGCLSSASLSIDKLTSLIDLKLINCPDICYLSGLHKLRNLEKLRLTSLPKLQVKDLFQSWPNCREKLQTDNLEMLEILSSKPSVSPRTLVLDFLEDETFIYEDLSLLIFLEHLIFSQCKIKYISTNFKNLSSLQEIQFIDCPDISQLPELPKSVKIIKITGCPVLTDRCQHNGEDWQKIAHIKYKYIE